jgi:mannose-6-phosphate isomerase-like protein (cupin superfamily)
MSKPVTGREYTDEPIRFPGLEVIDLAALANAVKERYRNHVLSKVNKSCLRLAVFEGEYRWHMLPESYELFVVLEGTMGIELRDKPAIRLSPVQAATVPAGIVHRTVGLGRTVNSCVEKLKAETVFLG